VTLKEKGVKRREQRTIFPRRNIIRGVRRASEQL